MATVEVPLRGKYAAGRSALISAEDADRVLPYRWGVDNVSVKSKRTRHLYVYGKVNGRKVYLHRYLMDFPPRPLVVDHLNGDGLDNRRENLRIATPSENGANRTTSNPRTHSRFHGIHLVSLRGGRYRYWHARVGYRGRVICLPIEKVEEHAAFARDVAVRVLFDGHAPISDVALPEFDARRIERAVLRKLADVVPDVLERAV